MVGETFEPATPWSRVSDVLLHLDGLGGGLERLPAWDAQHDFHFIAYGWRAGHKRAEPTDRVSLP